MLTPSQLDSPAFLMNAPLGYHAAVANNVWMEDLSDEDRVVDFDRAMSQWQAVYSYLSSQSLTYVLPTPRESLQDLPFVANMGIVVSPNDVVISNFTSEPRIGEAEVGKRFFDLSGYNVHKSPYKFEGEADLKHIKDNVYVGGYGQRTDKRTYEWMADKFDMNIVPVFMPDEKLYHFDCMLFPVTHDAVITCTELLSEEDLAAVESVAEVIDVPLDIAYSGICNSVRLGNTILNSSHLHECKRGDDEYQDELDKNRMLEDICSDLGFEVVYFNLSEYFKAGALLSCLVMHLNRFSYTIDLV